MDNTAPQSNRSNYILRIEDLLSYYIIRKTSSNGVKVKSFDIGTGANCILVLLFWVGVLLGQVEIQYCHHISTEIKIYFSLAKVN